MLGRGDPVRDDYEDVPGFCKTAGLEQLRAQNHVLTPGRYVGTAVQEDDDVPFEKKMEHLVAQLKDQRKEGASLDSAITQNLTALGFWNGDQDVKL